MCGWRRRAAPHRTVARSQDLGQGDDEIITVDLRRVPPSVCALFFIGTVASEGYSFKDVKSARLRLVDWVTGAETARFYPGMRCVRATGFCAEAATPCSALRPPA